VVGCLAGAAVPAGAGCIGRPGDPIEALIAGTGADAGAYRLVVIGRVTKVHRAVRDDQLGVVTPVELGVEAVLRTRNPGGTLPDGSGVGVGDGVAWQRGQRYVIAARVEPDGTFLAGGCGLTRALSRGQAAALAARYHAPYRRCRIPRCSSTTRRGWTGAAVSRAGWRWWSRWPSASWCWPVVLTGGGATRWPGRAGSGSRRPRGGRGAPSVVVVARR
jgi:hypothetical protein